MNILAFHRPSETGTTISRDKPSLIDSLNFILVPKNDPNEKCQNHEKEMSGKNPEVTYSEIIPGVMELTAGMNKLVKINYLENRQPVQGS